MHRHPYFDLMLHEDDELSALLGSRVVERPTLHEWPLSCVQRVTTADETRIIYKAQAAPTIEPEFYAAARSPLLPQARTIYHTEQHACMLIEFIDAPRLADLRLPAAEIERAASKSVLDAVNAPAGLIHSDLGGENVFVLGEDFRVIDWQYPKRGPADLDLAILLESTGLDPRDYVDTGVVRLMLLLRILWLTECATRWFTPGVESYDRQIVQLASALIKMCA